MTTTEAGGAWVAESGGVPDETGPSLTAPNVILPKRTKALYGFGSVAYGVKDASFNAFLMIFYNQVVGLPANQVGFAIMIAMIVDAVSDPFIGSFSDRLRTRWGRRHPLMYLSAVPVAILFWMLWNPPDWQGGALFVYLLVVVVGLRGILGLYEVPSTALAAELTGLYDERTRLVSYRYLFGILGGGVATAFAFGVLLVPTPEQPNGILNADGYHVYGLVAASVVFGSILISAWGTHSRIPTLPKATASGPASMRRLGRETLETVTNKSFLVVTISAMFSAMAGGLNNSLGTYFGTYFWQFTPQQLASMGLIYIVAAVLSFFVAPALSVRFGKKHAGITLAFLSLFVNNTPIVLKLMGVLDGMSQEALLAFFIGFSVIGLTFAFACLILVTSMILDVVEDSAIRTGRRSEGLFAAASSLVNKTVTGIGIFLAGIILESVAFPTNVAPADVDPTIVRDLVLTFMPTQFVLYFISITFLCFYRIDRKTHERNLETLAQREAGVP
ncbi:MFS transporter [Zavarzinia sp. CC-PAN008]|uniref:MFS transporter n=1 Tax=Zavarzinia sp. CC-PAN008 TaxID=3243332 RepID=UPI003F74380F